MHRGTRKSDLVSLCFWPGGEAANPDALHPGKPGNNPQGKVYFPPRIFPGFLGPEDLKFFVTPAQQTELVCLFQLCSFASCGSRGIIPLAQVWGRAAPSVPFPPIVDSVLKGPFSHRVCRLCSKKSRFSSRLSLTLNTRFCRIQSHTRYPGGAHTEYPVPGERCPARGTYSGWP